MVQRQCSAHTHQGQLPGHLRWAYLRIITDLVLGCPSRPPTAVPVRVRNAIPGRLDGCGPRRGRASARAFLAEADQAARLLGRDANHFWTAFGPTNVAIHRVSPAMELGDVQIAVDLGPGLDTTPLPTERRVRHALEVARALSTWNRADEALPIVRDAERMAPEQVRYHFLSRQLVLTWIKQQRTRPSFQLTDLARRLQVA
jgi:hypothetical protein